MLRHSRLHLLLLLERPIQPGRELVRDLLIASVVRGACVVGVGVVVGMAAGEVVLSGSVAAEGAMLAGRVGTLDALEGCVRVR